MQMVSQQIISFHICSTSPLIGDIQIKTTMSYSLRGSGPSLMPNCDRCTLHALVIRCPKGLHPVGAVFSGRGPLNRSRPGPACVHSLVFCKVCFAAESLPTLVAFKGPLSRVNTLMLYKAHSHIESISTLTTHIGLLS